ncbi:MAG: flagellar motor switch protein FliG [Nitrospirae bacterium]|nr:flagellar motor switch protein FliG [Candidatus Manganitrophaceae bacterium]
MRKLTGTDKTAILLLTLGEDVASEVMKHLDPKEVRKISATIAKLSDISQEEIDSVWSDFATHASAGAAPKLGGRDYLQRVLTKALGHERAAKVMSDFPASEETGLDELKWTEPKALSGLLRAEHPQTIALILTHLDPAQGGQILMQFPEELRADIGLRMATIEEIPPGMMKEITEALHGELQFVGGTPGKKVSGVKLVADLLNQVDQATEQAILTSISQNNPELAEKISQLMFTFDDLIQLDDRGMQEMLKEVSKDALAVALKAAKEAVKQKIFKNMSERAVQLLTEDMEARGPVKVSEVEKTQQAIIKIVRRLSEEGKIALGGKEDGDALV